MKLKLVVCFLFSTAILFGQNKQKDIICTVNSNKQIIYIGLYNPIKLSDKKYETMNMKMFVENGRFCPDSGTFSLWLPISEKNINNYYITSSELKPVTVSIYLYKGEDSILFKKQIFETKFVKDPIVYTGRYGMPYNKAKKINKSELLKSKICVKLPDSEKFNDLIIFTVVSFTIDFPNGSSFSATNGSFTQEMKKEIQKLNNNDRIEIKNIRTFGPDQTIRRLYPILINVTE